MPHRKAAPQASGSGDLTTLPGFFLPLTDEGSRRATLISCQVIPKHPLQITERQIGLIPSTIKVAMNYYQTLQNFGGGRHVFVTYSCPSSTWQQHRGEISSCCWFTSYKNQDWAKAKLGASNYNQDAAQLCGRDPHTYINFYYLSSYVIRKWLLWWETQFTQEGA